MYKLAVLLITLSMALPVWASDMNTQLLTAANEGKSEVVSHLLEKGADINTTDENGRTPLINASFKGDSETVKTLLDHGADTTVKDKSGSTALTLAKLKGDSQIVKMLEEAQGPKE